MGGEFFQCIKQRSFDHKKAGGVKERFAAVIKGTPSPSPRWANLLLVISYLFIPQPAYDPPPVCRIRRAYNILTRKTPIYCKKQTKPIGFI